MMRSRKFFATTSLSAASWWTPPGPCFHSARSIFWVFIDLWLIKDTPEEAKFPPFDTHDASSGHMHVELSTLDLLKKVFASKLMLLIALIGLTSGIFRNGIQNCIFIFAAEVKQPGAEFSKATGACCSAVRHHRWIFGRLDF